MGNAFFIQTNNIAGDQAIPAAADTIAFDTMIDCGSDDSTDAGIHAGSVAAAGKDTNSFYAHDVTS